MQATPATKWFGPGECRYIDPVANDLDVRQVAWRGGAASAACRGRTVTSFVQSIARAGNSVTHSESSNLGKLRQARQRAGLGQ
jgi:hypothetical protein